jgi:hypothetical protein
MLMVTQLTGFGAGGEPPLTLTQVLSATANAATIAVPGGVLAGDLLVLWDGSANLNVPPASVVPSSFTPVIDNAVDLGAAGIRGVLSAKIAAGTEGGTNLTGMNGSVNEPKMLYVFRGSRPIAAFLAGSTASEITNDSISPQVVAAAVGASPLIVLAGYYTGQVGSVDPRTFSPAKDGEINATAYAYLAYKIYNSGPADVTVDMDDEGGSNMLASCYIACS